MISELGDTLTVCDVKPRLAVTFLEELKHVTSSLEIDVEIISCEKDGEVSNADIILISAGEPRIPGIRMAHIDLAINNAEIAKIISEDTAPRNPGAKYVGITNPLDAMAMICKKYSKADFLIGTGTNLESIRFRSKLANVKVFNNEIQSWVGGEHGEAAISLWSKTRISNRSIDDFASSEKHKFERNDEVYIKQVSKFIVDNIGGTKYEPAASFRDATRAIVRNTNEILSVSIPIEFPVVSELIFIGISIRSGWKVGDSLYNTLARKEQDDILKACWKVYQTYITAIENLE